MTGGTLTEWVAHCRYQADLWAYRARDDDARNDRRRCERRETMAGRWRALADLAAAAAAVPGDFATSGEYEHGPEAPLRAAVERLADCLEADTTTEVVSS